MLIEREVEVVPYTCHDCGRTWTSRYEVTRWQDALGAAYEVYSVDGAVVPPPRLGAACPSCGAGRAVVFETPRRQVVSRETTPVPAAAPPTSGPRTPPTRGGRPHLTPRVRRFP